MQNLIQKNPNLYSSKFQYSQNGGFVNLHDMSRIPKDWIDVEISSGVEPEIDLLLSVSFSLGVDICMDNVRLTTEVAQKLEVYLIPTRSLGTQLQAAKFKDHALASRLILKTIRF